MSTTASIIAANSANAANIQAQAAAHRVRVDKCLIEIAGYQPHGATIETMQSYAECIETVYPQPITGHEVLIIKFFIIMAILGVIAGIVNGMRERYLTTVDYLTYGFIGMVVLPMVAGIFGGLCYGVYYLVTA